MARGRPFGTVRMRGSRYQAAYQSAGAGGRQIAKSFATKAEADLWLADEQVKLARGSWIDPAAGRRTLAEYVAGWQEAHSDVRHQTLGVRATLLNRYILPAFGSSQLSTLSSEAVRRWHGRLTADPEVGKTMPTRAVKLLRQILEDAVEDGVLPRNPARIKGLGRGTFSARTAIPLEQIWMIAKAIDHRYRGLVILGGFVGPRFGEMAGLQRRDVNPLHRTLHVRRQVTRGPSGQVRLGPPKTAAAVRDLAVPALVMDELSTTLEMNPDLSEEAMVFPGPEGGLLRDSNFRTRFWYPTLESLSLPRYHVHDLRHSAGTLAAQHTTSPADIQHRLGHSSMRASAHYLHSSPDRDAAVAERIGRALSGVESG